MENEVIFMAAVVAGLIFGICCCLCRKCQKTNTNNVREAISPQQQPQHFGHQLSFQQQQWQHPQQQINSVYNEVPISFLSHKIVAQENDPPPSYESVVNLPSLHNR